ncbi:TMPRSS9 [Symbiodinium necroappetens]|uniref:TMPRSS9 protein n=1 Tax=Symbiodinium necroappetens TaxID=1628268 RepID=A0A812MFU1_9DINO|nr:TMPRSS9 [Symbiodinium necroappetens]
MRQFLTDCWAIAVLTPFVCVGALPLRPDSLDIRKQISNEQPPAPNRTGTGAVLQQLLVNLNHTNGTLMAEFNNLVQENAGAVDDAAKLIRVNAHIVGGAVSQAILLGGAKLKRGDVSGAIQAVDESIVEARQKAAEANRSFRSAAWSAACVLMLFVAVGACWGVEHLLTLRGEKDPNVGVPRTEQDQDQYHHFPALGVLRFVLSGMVLLYNFYPWSTQEVKSVGLSGAKRNGGLSSASPTPDAQLRGAIQRRATQKPDLSQCGVLGLSQDDGSRIMHGKSAARCTWRWQVSLHDVRKNTTKSSHFCGGTLIDGKWVLTAAHCVGSFSQCDLRFVRVIAGAWKHNSESRLREGTSAERGVVRVHKHPRYGHAAPSDYDFALVELDEQLPMNECIGIACLPEADRSDGDQARWAQQCSITGWGASKDAGDAPSTLQEGSVSTLSQQDCIKDYAAHNATITAAMLCASGKSDAGITDACYGDSGGPLVCKENDRYVVRGITSWGLGCASEKFPGVYSRVTEALGWIHDTMAGKNSALADPVDFHGAMWTITSGPCTMDASRCISSPSFPSNYSINSFCFIRVNASSAVPIRVEEFATEPGFDQMLLNCRSFSGHESPAGVTPFTDIMWVSDVRGVAKGWKICPGA